MATPIMPCAPSCVQTSANQQSNIATAGSTMDIGAGTVPKGAQTSDYYRTFNIPDRFDNPGACYNAGNPVFSCVLDTASEQTYQSRPDDWFQGYSSRTVHPMYRTTSANYGSRPPTVHTMPTHFYAKSQQFSKHLGKCGMYRNHSLNSDLDKSSVPDH